MMGLNMIFFLNDVNFSKISFLFRNLFSPQGSPSPWPQFGRIKIDLLIKY